MRYRLRTLLIVLALGPMVLAIIIALGQLHWYRSLVEYGDGLPSGNDPAVQRMLDHVKVHPEPYDPREDWESD